MDPEESKYFHYPIVLHQKALEGVRGALDDGINYSIYAVAAKMNGDSDEERMDAATHYLGITVQNCRSSYNKGKAISSRGETVMVSVSKSILFDFYQNKKTEFEIIIFCAYAATRSIIGKKPFIKVTNEFLIARMFGYASIADMPASFKLRKEYKKYTQRYTLDKIKKELTDNWGLKLYGRYTRGFYISYTLGYETLVLYAEKNRKAYKDKILKAEKDAVLLRVLAKLNETVPI